MDSNSAYQYLRYPAYALYQITSLAQSEAGNYFYDIVPTFSQPSMPISGRMCVLP